MTVERMKPGSGDDGREAQSDDDLDWPTVAVEPGAPGLAPDHRTKATPRLPRAYVQRDSTTRAESLRPPDPLEDAAPEEGADLATALEPHLAWLAEPDRSELFVVLLKGQFALAISMLKEHSDRFPKNVSILRAMQMVERVAIHHFIGKLRPLDRVPVLVHKAPARTVTSAVTELLKLCDGVASLEEILRRSRSPRLPTLQILLRLVERGTIILSRPRHRALLDELPSADPPPPPSEPRVELYGHIEGRATIPDPVEARYQAALMRTPSNSLPKATLPGIQPLPESSPEPVPPPSELEATPIAIELAAPRGALFSIPNLELPAASKPPAPSFPREPADFGEHPTEQPTTIPSGRPAFAEQVAARSERSRRRVRLGAGLAVAAAAAFVLVLWARSPADPEVAPPSFEPSAAHAQAPVASAAPMVGPDGESATEVVRLSIEISPDYATVTVDGQSVRAPFQKELPRAEVEHVVEVAAPGYQTRAVTVTATRDATLIIALEPLPPKKPKKQPPEPADPGPAVVDPYE